LSSARNAPDRAGLREQRRFALVNTSKRRLAQCNKLRRIAGAMELRLDFRISPASNAPL